MTKENYHLINLHQTPEERRDKYAICLSYGLTPSQARRFRDLRMDWMMQNIGTVVRLRQPRQTDLPL